MHEASKGPPLPIGTGSSTVNSCTRHRRIHHSRLELASPPSTHSRTIEGSTTRDWNWLLHGQQMHEASKGPPLPTGTGSSTIYYTMNRCWMHRRVHHFRLELAPPRSTTQLKDAGCIE